MLQQVDSHGIWRGAGPAREAILPIETEALRHETAKVAQALIEAGYHGPFGVDAFRYRLEGTNHFQPRSEINARYTMCWGIAGPTEH